MKQKHVLVIENGEVTHQLRAVLEQAGMPKDAILHLEEVRGATNTAGLAECHLVYTIQEPRKVVMKEKSIIGLDGQPITN